MKLIRRNPRSRVPAGRRSTSRIVPCAAPCTVPCGARRLRLFVALLLACASLPAAAQDTQPELVKILVPQSTAALPFLLAAREQPIPGVELRVDLFANHAQALARLLRGEVDLLLSGTSQGWENRLDGSPIIMIDTGVWGISSLVGKNRAITSFADLRGKRIAMPFPGSPLDFQSRALLSFDKIDPDKDLTISYGPFAQSVQRLVSGQLDAAALPEPLATTVVKRMGLFRLVQYSQAWARLTAGDPRSPQVSLFATEKYVRGHVKELTRLTGAWDDASRAVAARPLEMAARFSRALSTDTAILDEAARNTLFEVPSAEENKSRVTAYYNMVSKFLPDVPRPLDERFFFAP